MVLDHLVVGAASLEQGVAHLRDLLGLELPFGGSHPLMGTHNCLTRIGDGIFLEIIAIEPGRTAPPRPRWFGLDDPAQRRRIAERPALIAWVAGTRDINAALRDAPADLGTPVEMTRGDLVWQIGIRDDGALPEAGVLPVLIQWPPGPHPSGRMTDLGIRLGALRLRHSDPGRIHLALDALGAAGLAEVASGTVPGIEADLRLPDGRVVTLT